MTHPLHFPSLPGPGSWSAELTAQLEREILPAYLPTCRWFGGKGRSLAGVRIGHDLAIGTLAEARLLIIEVSFAEGPGETYLLPLAIVDAAAGNAPAAVLARFGDGRLLCDAMHVAEVRSEILRLIVRPDAEPGLLRGTARASLDDTLFDRLAGESRVVSVEQSNTAVIFGDTWFLKLFRKFERGPNPDLELTQFLSEACGFAHVPAYLGSLRFADAAGDGVVALLSGFTANLGDGWSFALEAVASYLDRVKVSGATLTADAVAGLIGADFPARARQLGQRTGELHLALASGDDLPNLAVERYTAASLRTLSGEIEATARRVIADLERRLPELPAAARADAEAVVAGQPGLFARYGELHARPLDAGKMRVHGDYHLGQVLNTGDDFVILDFEGEPRRSLEERLLKRSPLVDVAGMLRSFDYAGAVGLQRQEPAVATDLQPWIRAWVESVSGAFLQTYFTTVAGAKFLPPESADIDLLLSVFILEKAIYEIGYELSYRPDFLPIPLRAVRRLLAGTTG